MIRCCSTYRKQLAKATVLLLLSTTYCSVRTSIFTDAASRAYPQGCANFPPSYYNYEVYPLPPPGLPSRSRDEFSLLRRLGAGKFSDVFEAVVDQNEVKSHGDSTQHQKSNDDADGCYIDPESLCVIKCLKPVSERKIKRELLVLSHCSNLPNLARLRGVVLSDYSTQGKLQKPPKETVPALQILDGYDYDQRQTIPILNRIVKNNMPCIILDHAGPTSRWLCHGRSCDLTSGTPPVLKKQSSNVSRRVAMKQGPIEEEDHHLSEYEIKYYIYHLLIALDALHSRGIMHRDVKSRNILINRVWPPRRESAKNSAESGWDFKRNQYGDEMMRMNAPSSNLMDPAPLTLIDLGLADFYLPNQRYNVRVASRHYKAPELLTGYEFYDYGIDMWGVGCVLAGLLLRREPLFRGKDNVDQLGKIVAILGSQDLFAFCTKYGVHLSRELENTVRKYTLRNNISGRRKSWLEVLRDSNNARNSKSSPCPVPSSEAMNLLDQLLVYDHQKRMTAREAMMHPFFDDVRELVKIEVESRWRS